ncbi:type II toxin-antitoxin system death-on-curing family toxin [Herbiconiux solani]|uniref:type II toxin-antitoxin system death-on-curing family toxin n=1 Tax=Herbiconiux solani TaxID=661329 RepID=UPI001FDF7FF9|nr:type II toxin-antitoxin system death-on-curing family toxin [Herbiconiux solani]
MNPYYLDRDDVLTASAAALGSMPVVRDFGLLDAAVARPRSTVFGVDSYPGLPEKAAALLHSLARNHALLDGNKRTAWAAAWVFLRVNGWRLDQGFDVDAAEKMMIEVAVGELDVAHIAALLGTFAANEQP